jgi:hypothetical protein
MNGVEIMTRVPRRHGDRHGESKDTSPKISNKSRLSLFLIWVSSKNERPDSPWPPQLYFRNPQLQRRQGS